MHSRHERAWKSQTNPWSKGLLISQTIHALVLLRGWPTEVFWAHFCIFLNANLPGPKNEKNRLFAHIRFIFEELSTWKSSILSRHTRELHPWGQICPSKRLWIWNSHKWLEANACRNLAQCYPRQSLVGFPHHNLKFRWNMKSLSACFSRGLVLHKQIYQGKSNMGMPH